MRTSWKSAFAISCALAIFCLGLWLGGHPSSLPSGMRDLFVSEESALTAEVIEAIEDDYFREIDEEKLRRSSLEGIVRALDDRFSHYFTPEETKHLLESTRGKRFGGIGITAAPDKRGLRAATVFDDSPAEKAGIRKNDVITAVNGKSIAKSDTDVATARIKGKPGTRVRLSVLRPATRKTRTLTVERQSIRVPAAFGRIAERGGDKLAVVQLAQFTSGAHGQLREEIDDQLARGAKGVVLDLRGNGGGLLQEAVLVSSVFIEKGRIVSTRGRTQRDRTYNAVGDAISGKIPMVVLIDRGSASASEIVTGALRDRRRATVVGTRTFGKGVFQEIKELSNGGSLDITVGRYYLPDGEGITDKGIRARVQARDDQETERDEALDVALDVLRRKLG